MYPVPAAPNVVSFTLYDVYAAITEIVPILDPVPPVGVTLNVVLIDGPNLQPSFVPTTNPANAITPLLTPVLVLKSFNIISPPSV